MKKLPKNKINNDICIFIVGLVRIRSYDLTIGVLADFEALNCLAKECNKKQKFDLIIEPAFMAITYCV
jgi:hypothetical protein